MTQRPTHEQGIAAAKAIGEEFGVDWATLRRIAADHLSQDWPADEGMGSSDVSIHLASLANWEPEYLREQAALAAERDALLTQIATSSGRSVEETLAGLRVLFAPADR